MSFTGRWTGTASPPAALIGRDLSRLQVFKYYPGVSPAEMLSTEDEVQ
jgi:hypothetical protein